MYFGPESLGNDDEQRRQYYTSLTKALEVGVSVAAGLVAVVSGVRGVQEFLQGAAENGPMTTAAVAAGVSAVSAWVAIPHEKRQAPPHPENLDSM